MSALTATFGDRIQVNSVLIVLCFLSVLLLESQSAASYASYLLAISMLVACARWNDLFELRMTWLIVALLVYLTASSLWSIPFEISDLAAMAGRALLVFAFVAAFAECQLRGQLRSWLGRALAVSGLLAVVAAIVVFYVTEPADNRLNGLGQLDTHVVAALVYSVVLIFLVDVAINDESRGWQRFALLSGAVIVFAVLMSDSRNAWASALIGFSIFVLAQWVRDRQRFVAAIAALAVVLGALLAVLLTNDVTREWLLPRGYSFRPQIWDAALTTVLERGLWLGAGINTSDDMVIDGIPFQHPHSLYVSVLFQGGIVGLGLFAFTIATVLRVLLVNYDYEDAKLGLGVLGVALPAYLLDEHEIVDKVGSTWFLFWLPTAIALGLRWRWHLGDR